MTNKLALGLAILALVVAISVAVKFQAPEILGGTAHFQKESFVEGLYAGTGRQFNVSRTGLLTTGANVVITTSNTATSSLQVGCIDTYATSTATAIRLSATTTPGIAYWTYGSCSGL